MIKRILLIALIPVMLLLAGIIPAQSSVLARRVSVNTALGDALPDSVVCGPLREIALKANLAYGALSSFSFAIEYPFASRWSADLSFSYNPWKFSDGESWRHWFVQPEIRYWTRHAMNGHFLGINAIGGVYNLNNIHFPYKIASASRDSRYEGWGIGAGLAYGYRWNFNRRWGMEGEIGAGYIRTNYDCYTPYKCGERVAEGSRNYFGLTKVALNLVYRFGKLNKKALPVVYRTRIEERTVRDTVVLRDTVRIESAPVAPAAPVYETVVRKQKHTLYLNYTVGSSVLRENYMDNRTQLATMIEALNRLKGDSNVLIRRIVIDGYCSVEGTAATNDRLAKNRAEGVATYLRHRRPDIAGLITSVGHGEDWEGLLRLAEEDGMEHLEDVRDIILNTDVYHGREGKLMRLAGGAPYRYMAREFFPKLRRIEFTIEYNVRTTEAVATGESKAK